MIGLNARSSVVSEYPVSTASSNPSTNSSTSQAPQQIALPGYPTPLASPPESSPTSPFLSLNQISVQRKSLLLQQSNDFQTIQEEEEVVLMEGITVPAAPDATESCALLVGTSIQRSDSFESLFVSSASIEKPIEHETLGATVSMDLSTPTIQNVMSNSPIISPCFSAELFSSPTSMTISSLLQLSKRKFSAEPEVEVEPLPISTNLSSPLKKRKSAPLRAIAAPTTSCEKVHQGIVQLDVFSPFLNNPKKLVPRDWRFRKLPTLSRTKSVNGVSLLSAAAAAELCPVRASSRIKSNMNGSQRSTSSSTSPRAASTSCPAKKPSLVRSYSTPNAVSQSEKSTPSSSQKRTLVGSGSLMNIEKDFDTDPSLRLVKTSINMENYKNTKGAPSVTWKKGGILHIPSNTPGYDQITVEERGICSTLRILPEQYLHIKETILAQVERRGPFKKRDAKSWFRIDVNKTAIIYDWFRALNWIPDEEAWVKEKKTRKC